MLTLAWREHRGPRRVPARPGTPRLFVAQEHLGVWDGGPPRAMLTTVG